MNILTGALRHISRSLYNLGFFIKTLKEAAFFMVRGRASFHTLIMQILFTFVEALGVSSFLALGIGAAVILYGMPFLSGFSQEQLIYPLLIMIITRELGPLLSAFIIIARSATAIATEVAGMVISHEVEAYISVGADPIEHLAAPRFIAVTVSLFFLNFYFSIFGLGGSYLVARIFNPLPAAVYFGNLIHHLTLYDLLLSMVKSIVFGMIISTVALIKGFSVERASTEIPVAGLQAVTSSFELCIGAELLLSAAYYINVGL
ncbi:MAG: ABC transporter permease [Spirochaetaceae bacterium]|nr:ABC transporter permease [Spirochaetaceae bacterium]